MSAWEGGSRVPFIARWPGKITAGSESNELLSTMDLYPTFANLAGAKLPKWDIDGKDATDFFLGQSDSPREDYFYYSGCLLTGVRVGKWKLVLPRSDDPAGTGWWGRLLEEIPEIQLYDLELDAAEAWNLAKGNPDIVKKLMKRIDWARKELGDIDQSGRGARFFDKGERRLQDPIGR